MNAYALTMLIKSKLAPTSRDDLNYFTEKSLVTKKNPRWPTSIDLTLLFEKSLFMIKKNLKKSKHWCRILFYTTLKHTKTKKYDWI